jgi:hypothetical protein
MVTIPIIRNIPYLNTTNNNNENPDKNSLKNITLSNQIILQDK